MDPDGFGLTGQDEYSLQLGGWFHGRLLELASVFWHGRLVAPFSCSVSTSGLRDREPGSSDVATHCSRCMEQAGHASSIRLLKSPATSPCTFDLRICGSAGIPFLVAVSPFHLATMSTANG